MASIIKVDDVQDAAGNNIINEAGDVITIGASGDTITIPSGATITNSGTATGFSKVLQVKQQQNGSLVYMWWLNVIYSNKFKFKYTLYVKCWYGHS